MVKAGVYLVAVLDPVFTATPGWRPITLTLGRRRRSSAGGGRRAAGAAAVRHQVLLAYGTVSQLGFLIVLTGLSTRAAALGGLALIISHALFKSTLFLVGIVDHTARTRDLRKLTAVGRSMPVVSIAAVVTGASMAAIPSTIGFTAKEAAFEAMTYLAADRDGARVPACRPCCWPSRSSRAPR